MQMEEKSQWKFGGLDEDEYYVYRKDPKWIKHEQKANKPVKNWYKKKPERETETEQVQWIRV